MEFGMLDVNSCCNCDLGDMSLVLEMFASPVAPVAPKSLRRFYGI